MVHLRWYCDVEINFFYSSAAENGGDTDAGGGDGVTCRCEGNALFKRQQHRC